MKIGRASRRLSLPLSRVGYAASGGSAPDIIRRLRLCNWAVTWLWCSSCAHEALGDQIEKPDLVYSPQINVGGVFDDETPQVFLVDEISIPVLLFSSCGTTKFGFEVAAFDPPRHCVGINSQSLCEPAGGIEAAVMLEPHSFQLEVDSGHGARVSSGLQLEARALVAHPRIPGQNA